MAAGIVARRKNQDTGDNTLCPNCGMTSRTELNAEIDTAACTRGSAAASSIATAPPYDRPYTPMGPEITPRNVRASINCERSRDSEYAVS